MAANPGCGGSSVNGDHHIDLTLLACHYVGLYGAAAKAFAGHAAEPDELDDVLVTIPGKGPVGEFHGQRFSSLTHFVPGYRWDADKSLGVLDGIGDLAMWAAGCYVGGSSAPMVLAVIGNPRTTLEDFPFPSGASMGSHWSTFAPWSPQRAWECHMVQDACIWHHATGRLLDGHRSFENQLEAEWFRRRRLARLASDENAFAAGLRASVESEIIHGRTVEEIIYENAEWARRWPKGFADHGECTGDTALAVCVRAIASTLAALRIMTTEAA